MANRPEAVPGPGRSTAAAAHRPRRRHRIEHALYLAFTTGLHLLPHTFSRPLGSTLGALLFRLDRGRRRLARDNIARALPELAPRSGRIARAAFRHLGATLCDAVSATRLGLEGLCRRLTLVDWEHAARCLEPGRGVFFMTAHLGSWEMAAHPVGIYGGGLHVVARAADNPLLDREFDRLRGRYGNRTIAKRGAARQILRVLQAGGRVGILIDQRVRLREGIELPFFGRPALTTTLLAKLSLRTGAPVVPCFCFLEPGGRYRLEVHPPVLPEVGGDDPAIALTRRYLEITETEIRRHPTEWMWMHDRWKLPAL